MSIDILTLAFDLSDHDLLARLGTLAGHEREVTAELVAHLAALDARPNLYAAHARRHNQYEADLIFGPRAGTALPRAIGHSPGGAHGPAVPTAPGTTRATPV